MIGRLEDFTIHNFEALKSAGLPGVLAAAVITILFFLSIYFAFSITSWLMTNFLLPAFKIGKRTYSNPYKKGQLHHEIKYSISSCLVFGLIAAVVFYLYDLRVINFELHTTPGTLLFQLALLLVWNEVHFYFTHLLLHTNALFAPIHSVHHKSVVPSPFSTYSLHPIEAFLTGTVICWLMPFIELSLAAMIIFPILSLSINTVAHSNYSLGKSDSTYLTLSTRHGAHHRDARTEYGFLLPILDALFSTLRRRTQ